MNERYDCVWDIELKIALIFMYAGVYFSTMKSSGKNSCYGSNGLLHTPPHEIDLAGICRFLSAVIVLVCMLLCELAPLHLSHSMVYGCA